MVVIAGRSAYYSLVRQHDNATVISADAYLVLGTNHAVALNAAQFATLDGEALVAVIQFGSHDSHHHLLAGSHIRGTTDNLDRLSLPHIHHADMHMVTIGMCLTRKHFANPKALQAAFYGLHFLYTVHLEAHTCQRVGHFLGGKGRVHILA